MLSGDFSYLHESGEGIGVFRLNFVDGSLGLVLVAAGEDDIIASLAQIPGHLVSQPRASTSHYYHTACHFLLSLQCKEKQRLKKNT